jgi:hypothetical protein
VRNKKHLPSASDRGLIGLQTSRSFGNHRGQKRDAFQSRENRNALFLHFRRLSMVA